ncbi:jerky protein [Perkinsela sp. CCAP 1560/4]|nr:jerky protein [Perkinsela sp. CCAP 1560/4]|eukprot:KNH07708.1 jerky protein [Perkinsela sp. CCAP 1560/4]
MNVVRQEKNISFSRGTFSRKPPRLTKKSQLFYAHEMMCTVLLNSMNLMASIDEAGPLFRWLSKNLKLLHGKMWKRRRINTSQRKGHYSSVRERKWNAQTFHAQNSACHHGKAWPLPYYHQEHT